MLARRPSRRRPSQTRRALLRVGAASTLGLIAGGTGSARQRAATGVVQDAVFATPLFAPGHPEVPGRVAAIADALDQSGLPLEPLPGRRVADKVLQAVHSVAHIQAVVRDAPLGDRLSRAAVGGACSALDRVFAGELRNAFVATRPPGHHALNTGREEGFCFYNHVAIAARWAQAEHGVERVLIIDWDYHHGNGTEWAFYDDASVLFFSVHDQHAYPGSGDPARRGAGQGLGFNINVHLGCGAGDADVATALTQQLLPAVKSFRPQLVLVSAGFDAHRDDPLGCFAMTPSGFAKLTRMALTIATEHAGGRLVSVLEGGYDIAGTAAAAVAHVDELVAAPG